MGFIDIYTCFINKHLEFYISVKDINAIITIKKYRT